MNIVIAGGTGFIGRPMADSLAADGHQVTILCRNQRREGSNPAERTWDGRSKGPWHEAVEQAEAVINLCGENIAEGRWTAARMEALRKSRIESTLALVSAMSLTPAPPKVLINASAVGYYGDRGDEVLDEASGPGDGFLAELCSAWEGEASKAIPLGVRTVYLRIGLVLAADGGALAKILPAFRLYVGGALGDGSQWMSWISREDLIAVVRFLLTSDVSGPVNATAPKPVTNLDFSAALARILDRPCLARVPAFALRAGFGEMAETLLASQRVLPHILEGRGFQFRHPDLEGALRHCLGQAR